MSDSNAAIEIADVSKKHVDVLVDETDISGIQTGQPVQITLDALPGITVTGQVDAIAPAGTISQGVVNYNVRVLLDPTDAPVKLDMTANASIIEATHENVLAVPTAAIRTGGPSGLGGQGGFTRQGGQRIQGPFVLVMRNGQPTPVQVTKGMTSGDLTEVSGDLQAGDQVIIMTATRTQGGSAGPGRPGGFFGGPGGRFFGD